MDPDIESIIDATNDEEVEEVEEVEEDDPDLDIIESSIEDLESTPIYNIKNTTKGKIPNAERNTRGYLTKFERAKIIGVRAQQIALGAVPNIELPQGHHLTPREIAREELNQKKTPIVIHRIYHDGKYEAWKVEELL